MIIYLSLKQLILNQIAVLIRKKADKDNVDQDRLEKRLRYLQSALEQMKSYDHNTNFRHVISHFHAGLSVHEQEKIKEIAKKYDDWDVHSRKVSKSGFTTTRSETLFTGAAEDTYGLYDQEHNHDDEKHSRFDSRRGPLWIHYQGFANWLRKQSFIKFKKRKDEKKYKLIWEYMLGLKLIKSWNSKQITRRQLIGPFSSKRPYIDISKIGTKEIVKASLLRLSIVQNRIFKFDIDLDEKASTHSRSRRSVDMENEDDPMVPVEQITANDLIQGKDLFNRVQNKDVLRIVATILFKRDLANNVLEELIQNPRFSMCGDYGKKIVDTLAKEMNLGMNREAVPGSSQRASNQQPLPSPSPREEPVAQFALRSVSPPKGQRAKSPGTLYSPQYASPQSDGHTDFSRKSNTAHSSSIASPSPGYHGYGHHGDHQMSSPSLSPNAGGIPKHKGHSDSVVYHGGDVGAVHGDHHKNVLSQIGYGDDGDHDGDYDESHSNDEMHYKLRGHR